MTLCVAENINIMSKTYGPAIRAREARPIQELAVRLTEAGADYLDLNLGPARKGGPEMMDWLVRTVQQVTDLPLYLDTTNADAVEAGLRAYQPKKGRAVINSISAVPAQMDRELPLVSKYDCDFVALCYGPEGIPRDENERGALAAELLFQAEKHGIPHDRIWFDPIVVPVATQCVQLQSCTAFVSMIPDLAPGVRSTCGLSNVSNGLTDARKRPILNQVYLAILLRHGLHAAIVDVLDRPLMDIARHRRPDLEALVARILDGGGTVPAGLSGEDLAVAKTVAVLTGKTLFSESWLEV